jgi:hypothetical protein
MAARELPRAIDRTGRAGEYRLVVKIAADIGSQVGRGDQLIGSERIKAPRGENLTVMLRSDGSIFKIDGEGAVVE